MPDHAIWPAQKCFGAGWFHVSNPACSVWRTMAQEQHWGAFAAAITAYCLFGGGRIIYREFAADRCNVAVFAMLRAGFAPCVFFLAGAITERGKLIYPKSWNELMVLFANGIFLVLSLALSSLGIDFLSASLFAAITLVDPVTTMVISMVAKAEPLPDFKTVAGWAKIVGFSLSMAGTVGLVVVKDTSSTHAGSRSGCHIQPPPHKFRIGILVSIASNVFWGFYFVVQRLTLSKTYPRWKKSPALLLAWATALASPIVLSSMPFVATVFERDTCLGRIGRWTFQSEAVLSIEYNLLVNSGLCMLMLAWSLSKLPPSHVALAFPSSVSAPPKCKKPRLKSRKQKS